MVFNERVVLEYIKDNLGSPKTHLELLDVELLNLITGRARLKFSTFYPITKLIRFSSDNLVLGYSNVYKIPLNVETLEDEEIISVENIVTDVTSDSSISERYVINSDDMFDGVNSALLAPPRNKLTFNYDAPNLLTVYSLYQDIFYAKVKIAHDIDLTTIPINQQEIFLENALILVAKKYITNSR